MVLLQYKRDTDIRKNVHLPLKTHRETKEGITFVPDRFRFEMVTRCQRQGTAVGAEDQTREQPLCEETSGCEKQKYIFYVRLWDTAFPFIINTQSVLRPVHSIFQSEFSTACDLVLPLSNSVSSRFLKVIQQLLTSTSSCSPPFYLPFNNLFQNPVPKQDMTNPK